MIKIFFIGGQELVVNVPSTDGLADALRDPDGVLQVVYDGHQMLLAVRAIAGIALLGR